MSNTSNTFNRLLAVDVRPYAEKVEGLSYIPWARAYGMAGMPAYQVVEFDGQPVRRLFGGSAVAVDMPVNGEGSPIQRNYLAIFDAKMVPVAQGKDDTRDLNDTIGRAIARALAVTHGLGLSLYSPCEGDGAAYAEYLGIDQATTDIGTISPLIDAKVNKKTGRSQDYLGWHAAVAACRASDPGFWWEVREFPDPENPGQTLPALAVSGGWMVSTIIHYRGRTSELRLPIMGVVPVQTRNGLKPMEHRPLANPTVMDWHRATMRCLAKCVAIHTGYGLELYAKGEVHPIAPKEDVQPDPPPANSAEREQLIATVEAMLTKTNSDAAMFLTWLGVPKLAEASDTKLARGLKALEVKLQASPANNPPN